MVARKFLVGGNWKMNGSLNLVNELSNEINAVHFNQSDVQVVIAPPFTLIDSARRAFGKQVEIAGQNACKEKSGAFTGEISVEMLREVGAEWVILGHSERRHVFNESDEMIKDKVDLSLKSLMKVIYCVGEKLDEREAGSTITVVERQLDAIKNVVADWKRVVIAYEPVWAIGTGKVATPQQAEEVHIQIRAWFSKNVSASTANEIQIIYGGSVSAGNCADLAKQPNIDGFLVGGASLKPEFIKIISSFENKRK